MMQELCEVKKWGGGVYILEFCLVAEAKARDFILPSGSAFYTDKLILLGKDQQCNLKTERVDASKCGRKRREKRQAGGFRK